MARGIVQAHLSIRGSEGLRIRDCTDFLADAAKNAAWGIRLKGLPMQSFQTDIGASGTNVPIREKAHSVISPADAAENAAWGIVWIR